MIHIVPLLGHELRAAMRRRGAYRLRLGAGALAVGLSCWGLFVWSEWSAATALGHSLLVIFGWAGFAGCLVAPLFLTADSVSRERREETLGLLFLTDLRGVDVILGKLAAKGIVPMYCLLAMCPSLAVCLIVGGVTPGEVWRLVLSLLNTLFLAMALTLLTSTLCRRQGVALGSALAVLVLFAGVLPMLGACFRGSSPAAARALKYLFSPLGTHLLVYDAPYRALSGWYWLSLLGTHLVAWSSLLVAGGWLRGVSLDEWTDYQARAEVSGISPEILARRRLARSELMSRNPMAWLASRDAARPRWIWALPALALGLVIGWDPNPFGNSAAQTAFILVGGLHGIFKWWVGADASREFSLGRLNGTLELLLSTRLEPREVAAGMLRAFSSRFLGPLLALLLTDLFLACRFLAAHLGPSAFWVVVLAAMLPIDLFCLFWVGLWRGLVARDPVRAMAATLFRVLVLPWIVFGLLGAVFMNSTASEFAGLWLFIGIVSDVVFLVNARDFFHGHFRSMALRPYGARAPRVESKWSPMNWETDE